MQNARSAAWKRACGGKHGGGGGRRHGGVWGEFVGGAFALRKRPTNAFRVRTAGGKSGFWFCGAPPVGFHFSPGRIPSVRLAGTARPTMGRTGGAVRPPAIPFRRGRGGGRREIMENIGVFTCFPRWRGWFFFRFPGAVPAAWSRGSATLPGRSPGGGTRFCASASGFSARGRFPLAVASGESVGCGVMDLECRTFDSAVCLPRPKGGRGEVAAWRGAGEGAENFFQSLENGGKFFPIIGKTGGVFQPLEKFFPIIGNFFSNRWKNRAGAGWRVLA